MSLPRTIRRVPRALEENNAMQHSEWETRLATLERSSKPPLVEVIAQTGAEAYKTTTGYVLVPGLTFTTPAESAWDVRCTIDTQIVNAGAEAGVDLFKGSEAQSEAVGIMSGTGRWPIVCEWEIPTCVKGTVLQIRAKRFGAGEVWMWPGHSKIIIAQCI